MYKRLCQGTVNTPGELILEEEVNGRISNFNKPSFLSLYKYNENQYKQFQENKTISGINDVVSDMLVWDLDSHTDIEDCKWDAHTLIEKLKKAGIDEKAIRLYFSGSKGFTVTVIIDKDLTPKELKSVCVDYFGKDLKTLDHVIYNANRILRIPWTKHETSGLHKIPLNINTIQHTKIDEIRAWAKDPKNIPDIEYKTASFDKSWLEVASTTKPSIITLSPILDLSVKPTWLTNCRYYLQEGHFKEGERSQALLCLGATYKNNGFNKTNTYHYLKGVAELQAMRSGKDKFPKEEIYTNIISQIFGPHWKGGQYSCRESGNFLYDYCQTLGTAKCLHQRDLLTIQTPDVCNLFQTYSANLDKNILYTGIESLDERMKLMCGTSNAIVAPPGVGKTSLITQVLNHNSLQNVHSVFFSFDMFSAALYMRMLQRQTGMTQDELYFIFKENGAKARELAAVLNEEYKNVHFCFKTGQRAEDMRETIRDVEQKIGDKVKFIAIDYNELVIADVADATAASAQTAQKIREIANEQQVCALTLLQPSKQYSTPADDIINFNSAKGSSAIAQSLTLMLGCSRPGFSPKYPEMDRFFNITALKNRNGGLFSLDFGWNGLQGTISELDDTSRRFLEEIRIKKEIEKKEKMGGWS